MGGTEERTSKLGKKTKEVTQSKQNKVKTKQRFRDL